LTGSAFLTGIRLKDPQQNNSGVSEGDFAWTSKSQSELKVSTGRQEAGLTMTVYGCSKCPSNLFKTCKEGFPGVMILLAGALDDDHMLPQFGEPDAEFWVQHRLPWVKEVVGAKQFQAFT
jgi:hypothetical protein